MPVSTPPVATAEHSVPNPRQSEPPRDVSAPRTLPPREPPRQSIAPPAQHFGNAREQAEAQLRWSCPFALNGGPCQRPADSDPAQIQHHLDAGLCFRFCEVPGCTQRVVLRDPGSHQCVVQPRPVQNRTPCPGNCGENFTRSNNLTSHLNRPRQTACRVAACRTGRWRQCERCGRVLDGQVGLAKHKARCVAQQAAANEANRARSRSVDEEAAIDALERLFEDRYEGSGPIASTSSAASSGSSGPTHSGPIRHDGPPVQRYSPMARPSFSGSPPSFDGALPRPSEQPQPRPTV